MKAAPNTSAVGAGAENDAPSRGAARPADEPQPRMMPEDARGWRVTYRGDGQREEVRAAIVVELDPEQKAWLFAVCREENVTPMEYLKRLIDKDRAAAPAWKERSGRSPVGASRKSARFTATTLRRPAMRFLCVIPSASEGSVAVATRGGQWG